MAKEREIYDPRRLVSKLKAGISEREIREGKISEERGEASQQIRKINKRMKKLQGLLSKGKGDRERIKEELKSLKGKRNQLLGLPVGFPAGTGKVSLREHVVPEKEKAEKGVTLPEEGVEKQRIVEEEEGKEVSEANEYYSIVPRNPGKGEDIYAYAHIAFDEERDSLIYSVKEPELSEEDQRLVGKIKKSLEEKLDVDFTKLGKVEASKYLRERAEETLEALGAGISGEREKAIKYFLERDFLGLGKIEPMVRDPNIEDISCDGAKIPIYVWHRNPKFGSMETDVKFEDPDELDSFVRGLAQRAGKSISMADPLVDAALPDGSRLQATLGTDIARKGSNFTIRKFTENPLTPVDLIEFGTIDPRTLAYLWMAIEHQKSALISGGTATGKTTLLNVVSLFIRPQMKIVTIEDTPELRLPHSHWIPEVAREPITESGKGETGKVDMYKLLKESLRQRPDYIIVGEVRGKEAFVLFQQMATGHPGLSTIHSENLERLVDRLTTRPIELPPSLLENLDIIVFLKKTRHRGSYIRRVNEVLEMKRYDREEDKPVVSELFTWDPEEDKINADNPSLVLEEISEERGMDEDEIKRDLKDRTKVIQWMARKDVKNLSAIHKIIEMYDSNKEEVMSKIESSW